MAWELVLGSRARALDSVLVATPRSRSSLGVTEAVQNRVALLGGINRRIGSDQTAWVEQPGVPDTFVLLRKVAIHILLNRPVTVNERTQIERLWQDFSTWEAQAVDAMSKAGIPSDEISEFKNLGLFAPASGVTPEHAKVVGIVREKITRLEGIIHRRRVSGTASPRRP